MMMKRYSAAMCAAQRARGSCVNSRDADFVWSASRPARQLQFDDASAAGRLTLVSRSWD